MVINHTKKNCRLSHCILTKLFIIWNNKSENPSGIKYRGNPWSGGVTSFYRLARRGGFSEGLDTSRRRRVNQGPTRQVGRLQVQGRDTSRRCHLTGSRHTTSLPPTRVHCPLCGYPSASFYLHRFNPFLFRRLGFFPFRLPSSSLHPLWHISVRVLRA
jgi:hypothetical protein